MSWIKKITTTVPAGATALSLLAGSCPAANAQNQKTLTEQDALNARLSNSDVLSLLKQGIFLEAHKGQDSLRNTILDDRLFDDYAALARKAGLDKPPALYVKRSNVTESGPSTSLPEIRSYETREGSRYIVVNAAAIKPDIWNTDQLKALLAFEIARFAQQDHSPGNMAHFRNTASQPMSAITLTNDADRLAAQLTCRPQDIISALEVVAGKAADALSHASGMDRGIAFQLIRTYYFDGHPSILDRERNLAQMNLGDSCRQASTRAGPGN